MVLRQAAEALLGKGCVCLQVVAGNPCLQALNFCDTSAKALYDSFPAKTVTWHVPKKPWRLHDNMQERKTTHAPEHYSHQ
eukprot:1152762-Pelagomonas_calceolata.AAC.3